MNTERHAADQSPRLSKNQAKEGSTVAVKDGSINHRTQQIKVTGIKEVNKQTQAMKYECKLGMDKTENYKNKL